MRLTTKATTECANTLLNDERYTNGDIVKVGAQSQWGNSIRSRLTPSAGKQHIQAFAARTAASLDPNERILDAGAGDSPYRHLFSHCAYEATDVCMRAERTYDCVTMKCDISSIPVESERYNAVLCTQVLEHVPDPSKALAELNRVLVPGGALWLSAPFYFEEHEQPYDFFRYTKFGLKHLLEQAGFEECQIEWLGGYYGTLSHQLNLARHHLSLSPKDYGGGIIGVASSLLAFLLKPLFLILAMAFSALDHHHRFIKKGHCIDYCAVARKPITK